eukprot:CAMPEP_0118917384 /NCGR_PEP_ID=MMETSP1166-20130328/17294_1 /TAXON_ID=1104430 /ORGANISM="Chrysoreinhardia sp, Strain CCMP3193" /LENGTH=193 /DNA_ID=CAMNT_0006857549 /DNA_START=88 /DNA_END=665 /DNA_ORIENTATION=-
MPKKFSLDVNDPMVQAVMGTPTGRRAWTDARLLSTLQQRGIRGAEDLSVEELNQKLGPKRPVGYDNATHGLYRRHYTIDGAFRCAYLILSSRERSDCFFDVRSVAFPQAEAGVWAASRAERTERRPEETKEETEEETDDTDMIDAVPAGAAGGRKRKETTKTNMTPAGKKERPEQPALEDLMKVEEQPPCVAT